MSTKGTIRDSLSEKDLCDGSVASSPDIIVSVTAKCQCDDLPSCVD